MHITFLFSLSLSLSVSSYKKGIGHFYKADLESI